MTTATPRPTATPSPTNTDTPRPTSTDTPPPTNTDTPTETTTPVSRSTQVLPGATLPPAPTAALQAAPIIPDVQGCMTRFDIDGQLYGHAFVENPVANDNGEMRVQYFLNGIPTTQVFPVQQGLTLGPFKAGDIVGDNSDSWTCNPTTQAPGSNSSGCVCVWVPTPARLDTATTRVLHILVCYDSAGNVVPGCPSSFACKLKGARV